MVEGYCHEIWGGEKRGGAPEFVEGLMGVAYGKALVKGGRAFLSTCL